VADAQLIGDARALVRAQELHRQFMRARPPSWVWGVGVHVRMALVLCALGGVALMIATGRLPPIVGGVALLFAIGLRRILLATALLLVVMAVTSLTFRPSSAPRPSASSRAADGSQPHRAMSPAPVRDR
jgi:hypothetical protein